MKSVSGKEFSKILKQQGWKLSRVQGSHHIYTKKGRKERISIPIHGKKDLKVGLLHHFMKIAGLKESDL